MIKEQRKLKDALIDLGVSVFALVGSLVLLTVPFMLLWNWLMTDLFLLPEITLIQSLGMTVLCQLLFRGNKLNKKFAKYVSDHLEN